MTGISPTLESLNLPGFKAKKVAIIAAQWHPEICNNLVAGAQLIFESAQITYENFKVSGSFELPLAAQLKLNQGFDGAVVLGLVMRGDTSHFDYICQGVTSGVMQVSLAKAKPIGFGVLMCDNLQQALERSQVGLGVGNKGEEAALAVLALWNMQA
ncbi:MAG: 6,7-dimethyl-8-ribityllumazine synthase [Actinobacteria bacterium]|jgi:6,7-dimethyl-8-ribityllumazine synthase|nr:6,7-dimethyl-8-ribityllumazine synthase [Candidatus Planktophila sp.]NQW74518.1 6,7-dimethyl-8-ribityllumazine synthase [Candidatus Planktophila sp.]PHX66839.1 MAG: 6,7-dimethyl-8-ribityllumazine synthase [Actinomycetota bacterium]